ncbi:hypothetical protein POSPLADRAFT_1045201 [Postia placenta MAD-698-R-SB12]|uniref:Uncharacterized protein n=1 Tax=Postia placenta MAD-698-R-SB12 TaxID=670580 RepID=A0A1X6N655_9APHY|nr:hypothetical protein POSPLADRAFT_1045201 [Postia placenta MAD-698-R-SB12]OSX64074.1 hypothetical protein POSPLADRAFT_1045201 [Postia placenta MAD-698-R-SB12]
MGTASRYGRISGSTVSRSCVRFFQREGVCEGCVAKRERGNGGGEEADGAEQSAEWLKGVCVDGWGGKCGAGSSSSAAVRWRSPACVLREMSSMVQRDQTEDATATSRRRIIAASSLLAVAGEEMAVIQWRCRDATITNVQRYPYRPTHWYDSFGVTGAGERSHSSAMNTSSSTSSAQNDTVLCIRGGLAHSHSSPAQLGDVRPDPLGVGGTLTSGVSGGVWNGNGGVSVSEALSSSGYRGRAAVVSSVRSGDLERLFVVCSNEYESEKAGAGKEQGGPW